jgi:hypothetical protein
MCASSRSPDGSGGRRDDRQRPSRAGHSRCPRRRRRNDPRSATSGRHGRPGGRSPMPADTVTGSPRVSPIAGRDGRHGSSPPVNGVAPASWSSCLLQALTALLRPANAWHFTIKTVVKTVFNRSLFDPSFLHRYDGAYLPSFRTPTGYANRRQLHPSRFTAHDDEVAQAHRGRRLWPRRADKISPTPNTRRGGTDHARHACDPTARPNHSGTRPWLPRKIVPSRPRPGRSSP